MPIIPAEISTTVVEPLNITPSTSSQTYSPTAEINGYGPVSVSAVTSSIDANITAGNIKSGVSILGVSGSVTELNGTTTSINPSTSSQTVTPTSPNNGFTSVTVPAVTSSIDANIQAGNIKDGVTILGVTGNYQGGGGGGALTSQYTILDGMTLMKPDTFMNLTGVCDIGPSVFYYAFYHSDITTADMSVITDIGAERACAYMFCGSALTTLDLSGLAYVYGNMGCQDMCAYSYLSTLTLGSLEEITSDYGMDGAFCGCPLTSVDLSTLKLLSGQNCLARAFQGGLFTTVSFDSLEDVSGSEALWGTFAGCPNLTTIYFRALTSNSFGPTTNQFNAMLDGVTGCTVHFPSNLQSVIGSWSDVQYGFGGTNTTVLFDLPATE